MEVITDTAYLNPLSSHHIRAHVPMEKAVTVIMTKCAKNLSEGIIHQDKKPIITPNSFLHKQHTQSGCLSLF